MAKYKVILFQPYLRRFFLNFGRNLPHFEFRHIATPPKKGIGYQSLGTFEKEINRTKVTWFVVIRRLLGLPNVRIRLGREGDLFFTYGSLVIGREPYCTYIETGLALYNYDFKIARNPIARWVVMFLTTRDTCKRLIFFSRAAKKSFFSTVHYPDAVVRRLKAKSSIIYPIPIAKEITMPKKWSGTLRLLFAGTFYIKGGIEIIHAFERLHAKYPNVTLTIVTALHSMRQRDVMYIRSMPQVTLHDAKLSEMEMISMYQTHDVFVLPTYRDGFGLVLIEAMAYGMPVIITDQYATAEMARDGHNGYVYPNHPFKDYDPKTYQIFGRYNDLKSLYRDLLSAQQKGELRPIEIFIEKSVEKFLLKPNRLETFSRNALRLYAEKFDSDMMSQKLNSVFLSAIRSKKNHLGG